MKNQYLITWELYRSWMFDGNVRRERRRLYLMIGWCILMAACLFMGVVSLLMGMWPEEILFFMFAVFSAYRAFLRNRLLAGRQFKAIGERFKKKEWVRTILFEDDRITISEEDFLVIKYSYSDIVDIKECGNNIYLDMQDKSVIRLYQSAFVDTDWNKCKAWIESHREQKTLGEKREASEEK